MEVPDDARDCSELFKVDESLHLVVVALVGEGQVLVHHRVEGNLRAGGSRCNMVV